MSTGPVVVAVLSHRDPPLLRRLVARVLDGRDTAVLLHHDPRGQPHQLRPHNRLIIVNDPQPCDWGRINFARAMIRCVETSLKAVPELQWVLLVSGQDYPAKHMTAVEDDLHSQSADALLRYFPVDKDPSGDVHHWQALGRKRYLQRMRLPASRRSVPFPRVSPFGSDTRLFIADTWVNLGRVAAEHLVESRRRLARVERYLSRCANPDEALLPTLLLNDADGLVVRPERRRYIRWVQGHAHPRFLTVADVPAILSSTDYFARKLDSQSTGDVLDLLDEDAKAT